MNQKIDQVEELDKPRRQWSLKKILASLLVALLIFGGGIAVGRGDLAIGGLSPNSSNSNLAPNLNYSSVDQLYNILRQDYDGSLSQAKLLDGLKSGLVRAAGDPYTEYFNASDAKKFNDALAGSFSGIGAELGTDNTNDIVIVSPLSGYPAEKAGLRPKDIISAIDGQPTAGLSIDAAVQKIRGPAGSKVTLTIVRGSQKPFEVAITRSQITIPSVKSQIDGNIGYLKISQFTDDTVKLATAAARNFKAKSVKGVVLDLRGDPGGFLSGAVDISSFWLKQGQTVVLEKRGGQILDTKTASGNNILQGIPTVVLIDGGSASAAEITAGALGDNKVATLVGDKSFGKGSVQQVETLAGGGELKVTVARWYTPNGKNIDKQGIMPDVVVGLSDADQKANRDPQKDKAYAVLRSMIH